MRLIKLVASIIIAVSSLFGIYYTLCLAAYTTSTTQEYVRK